ncbi:hypothetical protein GCM10009133_07900 [Cocleimonas flava]|uniref:Putative RDD family membrane protein YckC n=1 Tax=Cocleimonas flava TaxID=634765 RepID=A0A4R1F3M6_9GAMM|nr:RDD family protein [Cocleimonas flava]TCJ87154.1 putative RDD family membrane protein YckC [Cocleimonas flava]
MPETNLSSPAKIRSRLLAIFYDSLIVFFVIIISTLIIQQIIISSGLVNLQQVQISETEAINTIPATSPVNLFLKSLWLIVSFLYFAYFWTKRGQTPGMKVWKIKLVNNNNALVSWSQSLIRYITALFGLGLLLIPFNKPRHAIQDILSKTSLVHTQ